MNAADCSCLISIAVKHGSQTYGETLHLKLSELLTIMLNDLKAMTYSIRELESLLLKYEDRDESEA